MAEPVVPGGLLAAFRRHERRLAALWLGVTVLLLGAFTAAPTRAWLLGRVQWAADSYEARWDRRLAQGQRLVSAGQTEAAAAYLERLDRDFPARTSRHGRDRDRERLLRLLARSHEANGRNGRAMEAWSRLVAFDSLNYANHFGYAQAAERLLSGWALAPEARDGYARALALFPAHLPSLRGYVDYYMDRGEFGPVVQAYQAYLDAFLVERLTLQLGDTGVTLRIRADGRPHDVEITIPRPAGWSGELLLSAPLAFAVQQVTIVPAGRVGRPDPIVPRSLDLATIEYRRGTREGSAFVPDSGGAVAIPVPAQPLGVARIRLRLVLFKPMDAGLWALVARSYRNLLDPAGLAAARARTATFPTAARADAVLAGLPWAREGLVQELE